MADNNLSPPGEPVVTTPPTENQLIEDISNLLDDPEEDHVEEPEDEAAAKSEPEDDPLGLDDDAEDVGTDDDLDPDGSEEAEIKGGRFAPDSAKVTLENGETITIADLKVRVDSRVTDFQRDYTEKATALKAEKTQVDQRAQSLDQFQEYAAWYAEQHLPKQPEPFKGDPQTDPMGYLKWTQERDNWLTHVQDWQQFQAQHKAEQERRHGETQAQANERLAKEREALLKAIPVLKDPVKGKAAWDALVAGAQEHFGITAEEVNTVGDHRMLVALRDALAYRRIKAKAPQVQAQVAQKPVKPGRRAAPQAANSKERQARTERLQREHSFEAGVAALQDFDL
jgi:hypothetical protein